MEPIVIASGGDGASQEAIEKLQKMIQRVEGNLIRRITMMEGSLKRVEDLEDEIARMKGDLARALVPRDPDVTKDDFERWEVNVRKT